MITIRLDPDGRITAQVPDSPGALQAVLDRLRASGLTVHTEHETPEAEQNSPDTEGQIVSLTEHRAASANRRPQQKHPNNTTMAPQEMP